MSAPRDLLPKTCPKCGSGSAFTADVQPEWINKSYGHIRCSIPVVDEHLEWACRQCGWITWTPTYEAIVAERQRKDIES